MSSENGGRTPDNTIAHDKLNSTKVARMIALFAPGQKVTTGNIKYLMLQKYIPLYFTGGISFRYIS